MSLMPGLVCRDPPFAFLSSVTLELWAFRERIHQLGREHGRHVWVDEICHPKPFIKGDGLVVADELIRRIRESQLYICVLGPQRHGSAIPIFGINTSVSFFEVELFEAALGGIPMHVIVLDGFTPDPQLKLLLDILSFALPSDSLTNTVSEGAAIEKIKRLLEAPVRRQGPRLFRVPVVRYLAQAFYGSRGGMSSTYSGKRPLLFLDSHFLRPETPRLNLITEALRLHDLERDEQNRLTRLWIALRELIGTQPPTDPHDPLFACWNDALSAWADSASWYGLHAHLALSPLAAINSLATIRGNARRASLSDAPELQHPGGRLASAWYSIGRKLVERRSRRTAFEEAEREINQALAAQHSNRSNLLAIRGSVYRQRWQLSQAVADYEEVVRLRQGSNFDDGALGEGLSELGFGYLCQGRFSKGVQYMEKGTALLLRGGQREGFTARALRKLALGYLITGRLAQARDTRSRAREVALSVHANDQIR